VSTAVHFYPSNVTAGLVLDGVEPRPRYPRTMWLRLGDGLLEVVSDHEPLLRELDAFYGDCVIPDPPAVDGPHVRCTASLLPDRPLLALAFDGPREPDLIAVAHSPYRFRRRQVYLECPGPTPGWRLLVNRDAGNRLLLAANGRVGVVNLEEAPAEFVVDLVVCAVQSVQAGVLFLHAGSVGVSGSGALIVAPTNGGKSTTTLAIARRGHAFLGDDVAAIRVASRELLPFPRSAGLREGPLARSLEAEVRRCRHLRARNRHGIERTVVRVSDLFPWSVSGPLPLRFAFVLDGLAERAAISEFRPGLGDIPRLQALVTDTSASWGLSPGRDLMMFLTVVNLLSGLRCHLVQRGSPEETACAIEAVMMMEEACT
jgi:hypothetical protein